MEARPHLSSAQYVTAVLRFLDAYNRGDLDACLDACHSEIEWHMSPQLIEQGLYRGRPDVRQLLETLRTRWEDPKVHAEDFLEVGGNVMVICRFYGRGSFTQQPYEERESLVVSLGDDGKMRRVVRYPTPGEARRAIEALREQVARR
jgi:ketosteroid isomerase-like protein